MAKYVENRRNLTLSQNIPDLEYDLNLIKLSDSSFNTHTLFPKNETPIKSAGNNEIMWLFSSDRRVEKIGK